MPRPTYPDYDRDRFLVDVAQHKMTVLHDDGLYRHLRFRHPDHGFYWFDLITWPNTLVINGDMHTFAFSRVEDMFTFFRQSRGGRINPDYWAEKVIDGPERVRSYSREVFQEQAEEALKEYEAEYPELCDRYAVDKAAYDALPKADQWRTRTPVAPHLPEELRRELADANDDGETDYEDGARRLLSRWEGYGVVSDTWEWKLNEWTWHFLWCCHAIVWAIAKYDEAKKAVA